MDFSQYRLTDGQLHAVEETRKNFRLFYENPDKARPTLLIHPPVPSGWSVKERIHDKEKMLAHALNTVHAHLQLGDDYVPAVRVDFGTGQVAHAYGCELYEPDDSLPCPKNHIMQSIEEAETLPLPELKAGWFGRLEEYSEFFRNHLPEGVALQMPDLQGTFNNAHLVRGNDILYDFYDDPELLNILFSRMTGHLIELTQWAHSLCTPEQDGFFCDWGCLWKGSTRISNCSLHMLSIEFYREHIRQFDQQLIDAMGAGRIHYCGTHDNGLMDSFFEMPNMTGVDFDGKYHDLWELCERAPENVTLLVYATGDTRKRLLAGDWPKKRNIIIQSYVSSIEDGKALYQRLRDSMPY